MKNRLSYGQAFHSRYLSFFILLLLFFNFTGCWNKKDSSFSLYVKDSFLFMQGNSSSSNTSRVQILGTAFLIHFNAKKNYSSKGSLDLEKDQDLFLVTNFHVVCCFNLSSSLSLGIVREGEKINSLNFPSIFVKEPVAFSLIHDLAVFRLNREEISNMDLDFLAESSRDFQLELETGENSKPFHIFGFSGIENKASSMIATRRKVPAQFLSGPSESDSLYMLAESFGYYYTHYTGLSGSPIISSQSKALIGFVNITESPGYIRGIDVIYLKNLLKANSLDCSDLNLKKGGKCISEFLIRHLDKSYEKAELGDSLYQYALFSLITEQERKYSYSSRDSPIRNAICEKRKRIDCLDNKKLSFYIEQAVAIGLKDAEFLLGLKERKEAELLFSPNNNWLQAARKNHLTAKLFIKKYCIFRTLNSYTLICPLERRSSWLWLKTLAELGHVEAQLYYGQFLSCQNSNPLVDCDDEESSIWIQKARNHRDYSDFKRIFPILYGEF